MSNTHPALVAAAMACCGSMASGQTVLHSNGAWKTGAVAANGAAAPAGAQWSELGRDSASNTANGLLGVAATAPTGAQPRIADDFTVPPGAGGGAGWHIEQIRLYAYQLDSGATSPFTGMTVRIFNGLPTGGATGGQVVFGDETTNRLDSTTFAGAYRIAHSTTPQVCGGGGAPVPNLQRPVMEVVATIDHTFSPGTYWFDVSLTGQNGAAMVITTTAPGTRQASPAANAKYRAAGNWSSLIDTGIGCSPASVPQDFAFEIIGAPATGGCYANCDASTTPPVLNVADFGCFLQKYASGETYANCDQSTQPPVLNVADFGCFLQRYATGCE